MTKPSKRKTKAASRRKTAKAPAAPKPVDVVAEAPAPRAPESTDELKQEIAKFDHDGDGHVGGSKPHGEETADAVQEPATDPAQSDVAEPTAEATEEATVDAEAPAVVEPEAEKSEASVAPFEKCQVGPVEARVGQVPLGAVLGLLNLDGLRRIEAEKSTASFESVRQRLLATDGRATPVFFEESRDQGVAPSILHGFQELAAAEASGLDHVTVILIPAGGASEAQSHIVEMLRKDRAKEQTSNDDDLFYRVHAEG
jgi:pyruvate/2-oxoglutarate dehydrogenase complex dihydrolipoamide acyltransferase (E2) component